ncbi:MAG: hypothetical protein U1E65_27760 [Myxococcota bacterium]
MRTDKPKFSTEIVGGTIQVSVEAAEVSGNLVGATIGKDGTVVVDNKVVGSLEGIVGPELRPTTKEERSNTVRSTPGAALAEKLGADQEGFAWKEGLRDRLGDLSKQEQEELRRWMVKSDYAAPFLRSSANERKKNAAQHPALQGPISLEKLVAVARGEPWTETASSHSVPASVTADIPSVDRALWALRLANRPELLQSALASPPAFAGLAASGLEVDSSSFGWGMAALSWWKPETKEEAVSLLGASPKEALHQLEDIKFFFESIGGPEGLPMAKGLGVERAGEVVSERLRLSLTDYHSFRSVEDRQLLVDRFGWDALKTLAEGSRDNSAISSLRWYTARNAERAAVVKTAILNEGGAAIGQALGQLVALSNASLPKIGVALLSKLSFSEARALASAAQDYSGDKRPGYGLGELDRLGADEVVKRLRAGKPAGAVIEDAAREREARSSKVRAQASAQLSQVEARLGNKSDLASKLELFAALEKTHDALAMNPLPLKAGQWNDASVGPSSPLFERLMAAQKELLLAIGKEEAPKLVAAAKQGPEALRVATWKLMDRLEPIADPLPGWSYGGLSLADLKPVVALLPDALVGPFGQAFQAGRPRLELTASDKAGHTRQGGAPSFEPQHAVFRTATAVQYLGMFLGEGIAGSDRRRWEAAIDGPFVDQTGPYLLAAFSDTGNKIPSAERLPSLVILRAGADQAWSSADGAITIRRQALGLGLELAAKYRGE